MGLKVVIQCAAAKRNGGYLKAPDGRPVKFVAHPDLAPRSEKDAFFLAHPDDSAGSTGRPWRDLVVQYNRSHNCPERLFQAHELYTPPAYAALARKFGEANLFVLSAGWGLIPAHFLTPNYDITFSASAEAYKRRRQSDRFDDLAGLEDSGDPVVFLGGKDYLPLFCRLTAHVKAPRVVYFNSSVQPRAPGCRTVDYPTTQRTNWHYSCAMDLVSGSVVLPDGLTGRSPAR